MLSCKSNNRTNIKSTTKHKASNMKKVICVNIPLTPFKGGIKTSFERRYKGIIKTQLTTSMNQL